MRARPRPPPARPCFVPAVLLLLLHLGAGGSALAGPQAWVPAAPLQTMVELAGGLEPASVGSQHAGIIAHSAPAAPLRMVELGTYCHDCDETTPVIWPPGPAGALVLVEHHAGFRVREQAFAGTPGNSSRVLCAEIPGSSAVAFASAVVVKDTLWVFGTNDAATNASAAGPGGPPRTQVHAFWSSNAALAPGSWQHSIVLQLPTKDTALKGESWSAYNTSPWLGVLDGKPAWVMAVELGGPLSQIGVPFTAAFAVCEACAATGKLSAGWRMLDLSHIYTKARYSACPTIRYYGGWFYLVTLFEGQHHGTNCTSTSKRWNDCLASHISRSRDLVAWQESAFNPILGWPDGNDMSRPDHRIIPGSRLAVDEDPVWREVNENQTDDINRSDVRQCTQA